MRRTRGVSGHDISINEDGARRIGFVGGYELL